MGAINQAFEHSGRIDFAAVSTAAQSALTSLVQDWLPDGKREGSEWVARNPTRGDNKAGSFKVNLSTGVWSDFATGEAGGDAIDLLAYLNRTSKLDAAREIAQRLGVTAGTSVNISAGAIDEANAINGRSGRCTRNVPGPHPAGSGRQTAVRRGGRRGSAHPG